MASITLILLILAAIFFVLAAAGVPGRIGWTPLGLFCWVLAVILGTVHL